MTDLPKTSPTTSVAWDAGSSCAKSQVPPDQRALIRLVNVYKSFGPVKVFAGLNLRVRQRESVVILGPSGTGKSVLLKHITGLMKPDSGEVHYCQYRVDTSDEHELEEIRRHMGFL